MKPSFLIKSYNAGFRNLLHRFKRKASLFSAVFFLLFLNQSQSYVMPIQNKYKYQKELTRIQNILTEKALVWKNMGFF